MVANGKAVAKQISNYQNMYMHVTKYCSLGYTTGTWFGDRGVELGGWMDNILQLLFVKHIS